jgi:hypothetical protein
VVAGPDAGEPRDEAEPVGPLPGGVPSSPLAGTTPPGEGCVVLRSSPIGGRVWLDGEPSARSAGRSDAFSVRRAPGPLDVGMALATHDRPTHSVRFVVAAGIRHVVTCDLSSAGGCSVSSAEGTCR